MYCPLSHKTKFFFETKRKAELFIQYNAEKIKSENGYAPTRIYFCPACQAFHLTSKPLGRSVEYSDEYQQVVKKHCNKYYNRDKYENLYAIEKRELNELLNEATEILKQIKTCIKHHNDPKKHVEFSQKALRLKIMIQNMDYQCRRKREVLKKLSLIDEWTRKGAGKAFYSQVA